MSKKSIKPWQNQLLKGNGYSLNAYLTEEIHIAHVAELLKIVDDTFVEVVEVRTCTWVGCQTVLSLYNKGKMCYIHERKATEMKMAAEDIREEMKEKTRKSEIYARGKEKSK